MEIELPLALRPPRLGPSPAKLTDRGREILDQLGEIFMDEGFMHLTIEGLAARLRCSRRTLYDLAPSRNELVLVVVDRRLRRIGRVAEEFLRTIDEPFELLERFMLAGRSERHLSSSRMAEDATQTPSVSRLTQDYYRYHAAITQSIIEVGIERGVFRPVNARVLAEIVDGAFERFGNPVFRQQSGLTFEDATAELVDFLRHTLEPQLGEDSRSSTRARWAPADRNREHSALPRSGATTAKAT